MKKIFTLLFVAVATIASMNAADEVAFKIVFGGNGQAAADNTAIEGEFKGKKGPNFTDDAVMLEGKEYVGAHTLQNVYLAYRDAGVKFGTSKKIGTMKFDLTQAGQVEATKIVLNVSGYNTDIKYGRKTEIVCNGKTHATALADSTSQDYEFVLDGKKLEKMEITHTLAGGDAKRGHRFNLKSITVYVANSASEVVELNSEKAVASVRYYNLAGVESNVPFEGVNIKQVVYTDGTKQVTKFSK